MIIACLPAQADAASSGAATLELKDCELIGSQGFGRSRARCGVLSRPENPESPDGRHIDLALAVVPSLSPEPATDAFTLINGGPGGSSITLYADGAAAFGDILRERDIVIVDQRGTGRSNPLGCAELEDISSGFKPELVEEATDACLQTLNGDPRYYTTSIAVQDLEAVRETLGYTQLNVYGVSYGTRVALHYARRYPAAVRTLIIDGVAPPTLPLGPNAAINAQRTLDRLFQRCEADVDCQAAFPELGRKFTGLNARLREAPQSLTLAHPVTGKRESLDLTPEHLMVTVRMMSYAPETASLIPLIIEQAYSDNDYTPVAANALRIISELSSALQIGMHNAVVCAEDEPYFGDVDWAALDSTYMGSDQVRALMTMCNRWPRGMTDEDMKAPLSATTPTLILSGEEDPITPPAYGELVGSGLSNSLHLIGTGQGHGIFNRGCLPRLIGEFVAAGAWQEIDTACVQRLRHQPIFLDLMGPAP